MRLRNIFLLYTISSFLFFGICALKCGENEIANCIECGTGEKADTCISCEDKHFLFSIIYYVLLVMIHYMVKYHAKVIVMQLIMRRQEMSFVKKMDAKKAFIT